MKALNIINELVELTNIGTSDRYEVTVFAFGFILFKNGVNISDSAGNTFYTISRYLLNVLESITEVSEGR